VHVERFLHCCEGFSVADLLLPDGAVLLLVLLVRQGVFCCCLRVLSVALLVALLVLKGATSFSLLWSFGAFAQFAGCCCAGWCLC
jgi:hypothetical protein